MNLSRGGPSKLKAGFTLHREAVMIRAPRPRGPRHAASRLATGRPQRKDAKIPQKILAAVININTSERAWCLKTTRLRLDTIEALLDKVRGRLDDSFGGEEAGSLRAVVALPENLFARKNRREVEGGDLEYEDPLDGLEEYDIQMMQENAVSLFNDLKAISRRDENAGILLLPGTIAFRSPLDQSYASKARRAINHRIRFVIAQIEEAKLKKGELAPRHGDRSKLDRLITDLRQHIVSLREDRSHLPGEEVDLEETKAYIAHNACVGYLNGETVVRYFKHAGYNEVLSNSSSVIFSPGRSSGEFTCDEFRFGLEICRDHNEGVLRSRSDERTFHIQFVLSASVNEVTGNMPLVDGGYFIHASANHLQCTIKRKRTDGGLTVVGNQDPDTVDGYDVTFADLEL